MTAITTSQSALEGAASAIHDIAVRTRDISTHTGVLTWEVLTGAIPHVLAGELEVARKKLVTFLSARPHTIQVAEALGIVNRFGGETQTAILA